MSILNLSSLRDFFAVAPKKTSHKKSVSEKCSRKLALDSLEARILLSVTPNTATDILVNTEYSAIQDTDANGNSIAVDADGDFVATWTRTDYIFRDRSRNVGWYDSNDNLTFYTAQNYIDGFYINENGEKVNVNLRMSGETDQNIYARYFTDEVQRLTIDTSAVDDINNMLYSFEIQTGEYYIQEITFDPGMNITVQYELSFGDEEPVTFNFTNMTDLEYVYENAKNMQDALSQIFGEGNVEVSADTQAKYTVKFRADSFADADFRNGESVELITVKAANEELFAGASVKQTRAPEIFEVFVEYEKETDIYGKEKLKKYYDEDGNFIGYKIDAAATAEQLAVALMQSTVDEVLPPSLAQGGTAGGADSLIRDSYEVNVVPVYGLDETGKVIGFDVTFINSAGKQDIEQIVFKGVDYVTAANFDKVPEQLWNARTQLDSAAYFTTTLKQSSEEFRVNPTSNEIYNKKSKILRTTDQYNSSVALDADGDFAIAWTSDVFSTQVAGSWSDIYARTFSAQMYSSYKYDSAAKTGSYEILNDGKCWIATSNAFLVNDNTVNPNDDSAIAMDNDGNFAIVWSSTGQAFSYFNGVYMQRFDAEANKLGDEERVDAEVTGDAQFPQVAVSPDGSQTVVTWTWRGYDDNLYEPGGNGADVRMTIYEEKLQEDNSTLFTKVVDSIMVDDADSKSSVAINKNNQIMVAWQGGENLYSMYKWDGTALANPISMARSNSASLDGTGTVYWGKGLNTNVVLDADGDYLVSYDGYGNESVEDVSLAAIMKQYLEPQINEEQNADLLQYFDPAMDMLLYIPREKNMTWIHAYNGRELTVTGINANVDALIDTILAAAQNGTRDENGMFVRVVEDPEGTLEKDGVQYRIVTLAEDGYDVWQNAEIYNEGCTAEQYARLSNILHSVFDTVKGEGFGINFMMADAAPGYDGIDAGKQNILYTESIANANRDGTDARAYLSIPLTRFYDSTLPPAEWVDAEGKVTSRSDTLFTNEYVMNNEEGDDYGPVLDDEGNPIAKPLNDDDITDATILVQNFTFTIDYAYQDTGIDAFTGEAATILRDGTVGVTVDLSGCYDAVPGTVYKVLNKVSAASVIQNAIVTSLNGAGLLRASLEDVQVTVVGTSVGRGYDDTNFDLNGDDPFSADEVYFEVQFSGNLHDMTVAVRTSNPAISAKYVSYQLLDVRNAVGHFRVAVTKDGDNEDEKLAATRKTILGEGEDQYITWGEFEADDDSATKVQILRDTIARQLTLLGINDTMYDFDVVEVMSQREDGTWEVQELLRITFSDSSYHVSLFNAEPVISVESGEGENKGSKLVSVYNPLENPDLVWEGAENMSWVDPQRVPEGMERLGVTQHYLGDYGNKQHYSSVSMTPDGCFTFGWTEDATTTLGLPYQSIYYRAYQETYDTVGPEVAGLYYSDGQKIEANSQVVDYTEEGDSRGLIVTFTEDMMDWLKVTTNISESTMESNKTHSVTNPENWILLKDGSIVDNAISEIYFGMNASADPYIQRQGITALEQNKWEAVVIFNPDVEFGSGRYELILSRNIQDAYGIGLGIDGQNPDAVDVRIGFEIIESATDQTTVTPELVDGDGNRTAPDDNSASQVIKTDEDGNPILDKEGNPVLQEREGDQVLNDLEGEVWTPDATAVDPEGDSVTVWQSKEKGYEGLFAKIEYTKWDEDLGRTPIDEGEWTIQITDDKTACHASVDMDGAGNFVVTWTQNDAEEGSAPDWNIHARIYDLNGVAKSEEFVVNATTVGDQRYSRVAMSHAGDFVITWQGKDNKTGWDIYAQRYDAQGNDLGAVDEVQVLSFTKDCEGFFSIKYMDASGTVYETEMIEYAVNAYATRKVVQAALDAMVEKYGLQDNVSFKVTTNSMTELYIAIQVLDDSSLDVPDLNITHKLTQGDIAITTVQDGQLGEFMVNETTDNDQKYASIDMDYEGNFVISWTSYGTGSDALYEADIFARQFKSNAEQGMVSGIITADDFIVRDDDAEDPISTQAGIAQITVGNYMGSGVLLADGGNIYVLTAAHVVVGEDFRATKDNTSIWFYSDDGTKTTAQLDELYVHESYTFGDLADIAIIKLTSSFTGVVTGYEINRDTSADLNAVYTRLGFGISGTGTEGATVADDQLRYGKNKYEYAERGLLYYDFDDGTEENNTLQTEFGITSDLGLGDEETCACHGDSGGPSLVDGLVVAVCHGGTSDTSPYGTVGLDTQVAYYATWIDNITGANMEVIIGAAGGEFRVNSTTTVGDQRWSDVALDANGDFVVTWSSSEKTDQIYDVYAQRYDNTAQQVGENFRVNSTVAYDQQLSKVAMDVDGDFVIVWESYQEFMDGTMAGDPNNWGIYAQKYISNSKIGKDNTVGPNGEYADEFRVNTAIIGSQRLPSVDMTAAGDMYFAWQSNESLSEGIYTRTYYQAQDDAGPCVVSVGSSCHFTTKEVDADGNTTIVKSGEPKEIVINDGDVIKGFLNGFTITLDEQVIGQKVIGTDYFGNPVYENGANSIMSLTNIALLKDGIVVTTDYIERIELVGYDKTDETYQGSVDNHSEKNIYRVVFKDGVELGDGKYELIVRSRVEDRFDNNLDGNKDGEQGDDYELSFIISTDPDDKTSYKPLDPEFMPKDPEDADAADINDVANSTTNAKQDEPAIAMNSNGDYVVVWVSEIEAEVPADEEETDDTTTSEDEEEEEVIIKPKNKSVIVGQRFDRFGNAVGSEFYVSDFVDGIHTQPDVSMDDMGNFVVSWTVSGRDMNYDGMMDNNELASYDVYARVFNMVGQPTTDSFLVERGVVDGTAILETTQGHQNESSVIMSQDGTQFVVTWTNNDSRNAVDKYAVYAQRFDFDGKKIGESFIVNTADSYEQNLSSVGMDDKYNLYVVWQSTDSSQTGLNIWARRFDSANKASEQILVNSVTKADQKSPVIAVNDEGQFVVAWSSQVGSGYNIYFQCFNSNMTKIGSETQANTFTTFNQVSPSIAITREAVNGTRFAISWNSYGQEGLSSKSWGVYMNVYDGLTTRHSVTATGQEVLVNSYKAWTERDSDITMSAYGDIGIAWVGPSTAAENIIVTEEPENTDIFHKVYYNVILEDYVPIEGESNDTGENSLIINKGSYSYNSDKENGGGTIEVENSATNIQAAPDSGNKFVFDMTSGMPQVALNDVALTVSGTNYVFDASASGRYKTEVIINGLSGENLVVENGSFIVNGTGWKLTVLNASSVVFNGSNIVASVTAADGEVFTREGDSIALTGKNTVYRIEGCVNVTAIGSAQAVAKLTGTEEDEQFQVEKDAVTVSSGAKETNAVGFGQVYLRGMGTDSVYFSDEGNFDVAANTVTYVADQDAMTVQASDFVTVEVSANGKSYAIDGESFITSDDFKLTFDSAEYAFTVDSSSNLTINAAGGVQVIDTTAADTVIIAKDSVKLGDSVEVKGIDSAAVVFENGGNDTISVIGTAAGESFILTAENVSGNVGDLEFTALGAKNVTIDGKGGKDSVTATDTSDDDLIAAGPNSMTLESANYVWNVSNIQNIRINQQNGGEDSVQVTDSASNDKVVLSPKFVTMTNSKSQLTITGFNRIAVQSTIGNDAAVLYDSVGNDTLTIEDGSVSLSGTDFFNQVSGFRKINAYSMNGGQDKISANVEIQVLDDLFTAEGEDWMVNGFGFDF